MIKNEFSATISVKNDCIAFCTRILKDRQNFHLHEVDNL